MTPKEKVTLIAILLASVIMSVTTVIGFVALIKFIWSFI